MSIKDIPMTWEDAKSLIDTKHLERLYRSTATFKRYGEYKRDLESKNDKVVQFIIRERLQWVNEEGDLDLEPTGDKIFQNPKDFRIIMNDFPYNFEDNMTHVCAWSKLTIDSDPNSEMGDVSPYVKRLIDRYVEKTFVEHLGLKKENVMWFRNYPILQSVKELSHIHVLIRDIEPSQLSEIVGKSIVPLEESDY